MCKHNNLWYCIIHVYKLASKLIMPNYLPLKSIFGCICRSTLIPIGEDQRQHLDLCEDLAISFNNKFGKVFRVPKMLLGKCLHIFDISSASRIVSNYCTCISILCRHSKVNFRKFSFIHDFYFRCTTRFYFVIIQLSSVILLNDFYWCSKLMYFACVAWHCGLDMLGWLWLVSLVEKQYNPPTCLNKAIPGIHCASVSS